MEIGLQLRQAMLVNGMLFNSEAWHAVSEKEIKLLETVDEYLLRSLVKGHSKTPLEFLYLEAGAMPISFIIICRRLMYLQTIIKRPEHELVRRVYAAQKSEPIKGDFYNLVQDDFEILGEKYNEEYLLQKSKNAFKNEIKAKVRAAALDYLKNKKEEHSKIRKIEYQKLHVQHYMTSPLFTNQEVNLLHANVKDNYKHKYQANLLCSLCKKERDDQAHVINCEVLNRLIRTREVVMENCVYDDIFADHLKQNQITHLYNQFLEVRNTLLDENLNVRDPSILDEMLRRNDNVHNCIVRYSCGK